MIVDFHTHIFPPSVRNARERFLVIEPAFELLYGSSKAQMAGVEELIATMDDQGVDKAVTFGFPWRIADHFKRHNDYILESVARFPGRLIGFGCCDTANPEAAAETERCLGAGLAGMGELAFYCGDMDGSTLSGLESVLEICRRLDRPVLIHTNEPVGHVYPGKTTNTLAQIYALVRRFNQNRIVLAHWGGGLFFYQLLKKEVAQSLVNVWFDTAASPFLYREEIYHLAVRLAGGHKILWGSDFPLISPRRYFDEMVRSGLDEEARRHICGKNAMELLGLE